MQYWHMQVKGNKDAYIDYRGFVTETLKRLERDNNGN